MSYFPFDSNSYTTAAQVAAELAQHEEEQMSGYTPRDLAEGWEFKILRTGSALFRRPESLQAILAEEHEKGGWVLVEKFDDQRIRLKRPSGFKVPPGELADGYDPYRTTVGPTLWAPILIALISSMVLVLSIILVLTLLAKPPVPSPPVGLPQMASPPVVRDGMEVRKSGQSTERK